MSDSRELWSDLPRGSLVDLSYSDKFHRGYIVFGNSGLNLRHGPLMWVGIDGCVLGTGAILTYNYCPEWLVVGPKQSLKG